MTEHHASAPDATNGEIDRDRPYWAAFRLAEITSSSRMTALREHFGSLEAAWKASTPQLRSVLGDRPRALTKLVEARGSIEIGAIMGKFDRDGVSIVTIADDSYPRLLREIAAPPPVLFFKGQLLETDANAVAVVGTRRVTPYGKAMATEIGAGLARAGVTVVSGLATGVDGIAHRAALDAGGRTFAVLGSGIYDIYPRDHAELAKRVAAQGALISDNLPNAKPDRWNFPARNRLISGLSLGVVVIEAPEKSGALITVDFAADQGRDVFAVPGMTSAPTSAGCNRILRDGARLVRHVDDILEDLRIRSASIDESVQQPLVLDETERLVLNVLTSEPRHIDDIVELCGLPLPQVSGVLLTLELQQLVRNVGAQHYTRH